MYSKRVFQWGLLTTLLSYALASKDFKSYAKRLTRALSLINHSFLKRQKKIFHKVISVKIVKTGINVVFQ
jgi:hypothetical protein